MASVFLLLDAFRHDYLSERFTPFLWQCAQEGEHYQRVVQSLGFCERSEILTGATAETSGFLTAIGYDPENSPFRHTHGLRILGALERVVVAGLRNFDGQFAARCHRRLRAHVNKHLRGKGIAMSTYMIPFSMLKYFALTEDRIDHRRPEAFGRPSILTLLTQAGRKYFYDTFTALNMQSLYTSDQARLDALPQVIEKENYDFFLVFVSLLDGVGHRFGPGSDEVRAALRDLDGRLRSFVGEVERRKPGNRYVFLGDHGMLPVSKIINAGEEVLARLRSADLSTPSDFIYFLDSTMVRVWSMSDRAQTLISRALNSSDVLCQNGSFLDAPMARRLHVPWGDRRYGDLLWLAKPGVLVFPDFFHRLHPCKGMHGYDPEVAESQGTCIHWGRDVTPSVYPSIPLVRVHEILKESMEL